MAKFASRNDKIRIINKNKMSTIKKEKPNLPSSTNWDFDMKKLIEDAKKIKELEAREKEFMYEEK